MTSLLDLTANYYDPLAEGMVHEVVNVHHHQLGCCNPDDTRSHRHAVVELQGAELHIYHQDCRQELNMPRTKIYDQYMEQLFEI